MRLLPVFACTALVTVSPLLAQETTQPPPAAQEGRETRRRPLADVADLEPAVDVSGSRAAAPAQAAAPSAEPAVAASGPRRASDTLDLGTTSITGNQELPKVLYIVPWKRSDLGNHVGRPVNTLLDEVLEPIDPEVFERNLDYYETLYGERQEE